MPDNSLVVISGTLVRSAVQFTDFDGSPIDPPEGVEVQWRAGGTDVVQTFVYGTDLEVVRDSVGAYHMDFQTDCGGPSQCILWTQWVGIDFVLGITLVKVEPDKMVVA